MYMYVCECTVCQYVYIWQYMCINVFSNFSPMFLLLSLVSGADLLSSSVEPCATLGNYPTDKQHVETSLAQPANPVPLQPDRTEATHHDRVNKAKSWEWWGKAIFTWFTHCKSSNTQVCSRIGTHARQSYFKLIHFVRYARWRLSSLILFLHNFCPSYSRKIKQHISTTWVCVS